MSLFSKEKKYSVIYLVSSGILLKKKKKSGLNLLASYAIFIT